MKLWQRWKQKRQRRGFDAAKTGRLYSDWLKTSQSLDYDIKAGLTTLRARSRNFIQNNDYGQRFAFLLKSNVIGPKGIILQSKARSKTANGNGKDTVDKAAAEKIEKAWKKFSRKENCSVDRQASMLDIQNMFIEGLPRDGEFIIRKVKGFDNPFKFALQLIEPDYLDHNFSDPMRKIKMGIQRNDWKQPVAYHFLKEHPGESMAIMIGEDRQVVPADEIWHTFVKRRPEQSRGSPWTVTALKRMHMLGKYEETELISSRAGSAKMGFFQTREGLGWGDEKEDSGRFIKEVSPGTFEVLPEGYEFKAFDVDHPNAGFDAFHSSVLHGACSGLNVSYAGLSSNVSRANYSSMRQGELSDRDAYMLLQQFTIENLLQPVFETWLPLAIATGEISLPMKDLDRWLEVAWLPRRWAWVDPQKDMSANKGALDMRITSRRRLAAQQGYDYDEINEELKDEENDIRKSRQGSKPNGQENN